MKTNSILILSLTITSFLLLLLFDMSENEVIKANQTAASCLETANTWKHLWQHADEVANDEAAMCRECETIVKSLTAKLKEEHDARMDYENQAYDLLKKTAEQEKTIEFLQQ